ncbi:MAG: TMEM175 family protein [bacterium]
MTRGRLEAFSDGVIAILITIMVLELETPHGTDWLALREKAPVFAAYVVSFVYLGIYWNNHHHMFHLVQRISGGILWANLHLLFWLSLIPFATAWAGEHDFAPLPTAVYGGVLFLSALAWLILQTTIIADQGPGSRLAEAVGNDAKGKVSALLYASAIPLAFLNAWISCGLYVLVALLWLVPDRRFASRASA